MEIFGITVAWETLGFIAAFIASEVIGSSNHKHNSIAQVITPYIEKFLPTRKNKEKHKQKKRRGALNSKINNRIQLAMLEDHMTRIENKLDQILIRNS